jgi:hypothetical protein
MKIYIEKWTTETVHTGKLFSVDTEKLRELYDEYAGLSDEELVELVSEDSECGGLDWHEQYEDALSACDISGENSLVKIHTSETLQEDLEWNAWHRGRLTLNEEYIDIDTENFEEFVSKIPHYK